MYSQLWGSNPGSEDTFKSLSSHLVDVQKVPRFAYSILTDTRSPDNLIESWEILLDMNADESSPEETDWEEIHLRNFKCSIDTKLRSFYFKVFHKAIAINDFLFKINRKDSPNCNFCKKKIPESSIHVFFFFFFFVSVIL